MVIALIRYPLGDSKELSVARLAMLAGSAELDSEHVLGKAIQAWAKSPQASRTTLTLSQPGDFHAETGRGIRCIVR